MTGFFLDPALSVNFGSLTSEEEGGIREAVRRAGIHPGPFVEIGSLFGFTTNLIALLKEPERELIGLDNLSWNPLGLEPEHHRKILECSLRIATERLNTRLVYRDAAEFYKTYDGEVPALVFIDAGHEYEEVRADIDWASKLGVPIICGHDYSSRFPGVVRAVQECFGDDVRLHGSLWIAERAR